MSYKIRIPSENSDTVGRFAVTAGTPDAIITFPTESGEVATTSDIPQGGSTTTTYVLQNTYSDSTTDDPQVITEWDVPIIAGKLYRFEYGLFGRAETGGTFDVGNFKIYYQTSSFANPISFGFTGTQNTYTQNGNYDLSTASLGFDLPGGVTVIDVYSGVLISSDNGTLRHIVQNVSPFSAPYSSSYVAGESYLQVTQLN